MAATTILRLALLTCRTTAPSEAGNVKPWSKRTPDGCRGRILHLRIRRYTGLREEKSEHAEGRIRATTLYEFVVSMTSAPVWFLYRPFKLRARTTTTRPLKTPATSSGSSAN